MSACDGPLAYRCAFMGEPPGRHVWDGETGATIDPDDVGYDPPPLCCPAHDPRCSLCGREVPADAADPLCTTCERTARAGGKLLADAARYPDPEGRAATPEPYDVSRDPALPGELFSGDPADRWWFEEGR